MLIKDVMQTKLTTIPPAAPLAEAVALMAARHIRHLPVLERGWLVGIVSDRDLKSAIAPDGGDAATGLARSVSSVMTRDVVTIGPDFPVEDAARLMVREKISALPVIETDQVLGIVTETDILRLFVKALGASEPSSRIDIVIGRHDAVAHVVQSVEQTGARITSVLTLENADGKPVAVLPTCVGPDRPAAFPPTTGGQHLLDMINATFDYHRQKKG